MVGDYTSLLKKLTKDTPVKLEGPYGRFCYHYHGKNQIWIAGGIGITPFLSMAGSLNDPSYNIDLFYSVHNQQEAIYLNELVHISSRIKGFRVFPFYTEAQGRLNAEIVQATVGNLKGKEIFLCGPPPMMKALRSQFNKLKVHNRKIHSEEFQLL